MDQQNKKQIQIMAGLGAVLVAVLVYQFVIAAPPGGAPPPGTPSAAGPAGAGAVPAAGVAAQSAPTLAHTDVDAKVLLASLNQPPIDYKTVRIQRDPMEPLIGKGPKPPDPNKPPEPTEPTSVSGTQKTPDQLRAELIVSVQGKRITAIVWDARAPVAVVDDEIVSVGYTYPDGVRVDAIEPSRVVFMVDGQQISVEMKEK